MNESATLDGDKVLLTIHPWEILTMAVMYRHGAAEQISKK